MKDIKTREIKKDIKVLHRTRKGIDKTKTGYEHIKEQTSSNEEVHSPIDYARTNGKKILVTSGKGVKRQVQGTTARLEQQPANLQRFQEMREVDKKRKAQRKKEKEKKDIKKKDRKKEIKKRSSSGNDDVSIKRKNSSNVVKSKKNTPKIKDGNTGLTSFSLKQRYAKGRSFNAHNAPKPKTISARYENIKNSITKTKSALKRTYKSVVRSLRRIVEYSRLLIAALMACGSFVITIIVVVSLAGMLIVSPLAIFFSNDSSKGDSMTLSEAIVEINTEYNDKINEIKDEITHDEVDISSGRASWKDVLSVYAVKTVSGDEIDVVTIDDERLQILKDVFFDTNVLEHTVDDITVDEVSVSDDGNGNLVEETQSVNKKVLKITTTGKTAEEMATEYNFTDDQVEQLNEMLSAQYDDTWKELLYGASIGTGDMTIVEIAISQLGNVGGQPYWSWYGFTSRAEWCACFVSWCANEAGYIDAGILPKFAACQNQGIPWFQNRGLWQSREYTPKPGDIIFFDWENDGHSDHVGIVEKVEGNTVYTIEGNSNDTCSGRSYLIGSTLIAGYGTPIYN